MKVDRPKVAFYSHDTMGLGHMRRNVLLARALADSRLEAIPLMIAGAPEAVDVCRAAGVPCIALPPLAKSPDGHYTSRTLEVCLDDLITLRGRTIRAALEAFEPDALIVDNVPRGAKGELNDALSYIGERKQARCVLGLRDVLDAAHTVRREWALARNFEAARDFYDEIWVYGDPAVCDPVHEYGFPPSLAERTHHVGYLDQRSRLESAHDSWERLAPGLNPAHGRLALCVVGGGQDGGALAEAFAAAARPADMNAIIVTGPFMPEALTATLRRAADQDPTLCVIDFVQEPVQLLARADRVVAMGGYNSVCEILSIGKPALIVPRVAPRREQAIRAERLAALGLIDVLPSDALSPDRISAWLACDLGPRSGRGKIDLKGLVRVADRLERLLAPAAGTLTGRRDSAVMKGARYGA